MALSSERRVLRPHRLRHAHLCYRSATHYSFCADCLHGKACEGGCTEMAVTYFGRRGDNPMCFYRIEREWEA